MVTKPALCCHSGAASSGGFNASGIGRELGRQGMHAFTETHVMAVPSES